MRMIPVLLAASVAFTIPPVDAHGACGHAAYALHTYGLGASAGVYSWTAQSASDAGGVVVFDTNLQDCDGDAVPGDFDGDFDAGLGGGFFGYGPDATPCGLDAWGPSVTVADITGLGISFVIGEDGPAPVGHSASKVDAASFVWTLDYFGHPRNHDVWIPCAGDGVISPQSDPGDCLSTVYHGTGTTCGAGGADGGYWVFLLSPEVSEDGNGWTVGNTPTVGTIMQPS